MIALIRKKIKKFSYDDRELNFEQKKGIIDQLSGGNYRIDFSGGELLIDPLNVDLICYASEKLGKENIGISVSGAFINDKLINKLKDRIHDVEITLDYVPFKPYKLRPVGYHEYAAHAIQKLKRKNIYVGAQTVLTNENIAFEKIDQLFGWLVKNNVDDWRILRFLPSGRGESYRFLTPTHLQYCEAVSYIKKISQKSNVNISFQYLLPNHDKYTLKCRSVKKSIGILPNGMVTACFWALDRNMIPKDNSFILGKLPDENIKDILTSEKALKWKNNCMNCKIFTKESLEKEII